MQIPAIISGILRRRNPTIHDWFQIQNLSTEKISTIDMSRTKLIQSISPQEEGTRNQSRMIVDVTVFMARVPLRSFLARVPVPLRVQTLQRDVRS